MRALASVLALAPGLVRLALALVCLAAFAPRVVVVPAVPLRAVPLRAVPLQAVPLQLLQLVQLRAVPLRLLRRLQLQLRLRRVVQLRWLLRPRASPMPASEIVLQFGQQHDAWSRGFATSLQPK